MQVTLQACRGHTHLVVVEVVTRRETDVPSVTDSDVTTHIERLCKLVWVTHGLLIELLTACILTHRDTISEGQRPRHLESHIAIRVGLSLATLLLGSSLSLLQGIVHITFNISIQSILFSSYSAFIFPLRNCRCHPHPLFQSQHH